MIPNHKKKRFVVLPTLIFIFVGIILGAIVISSYIIYQEQQLSDRIYPNVYIDNINVGRQSREEIERMFSKNQQRFSSVMTTIYYHDEPIATYSAKTLDLHMDVDDAFNQAYLVGRDDKTTTRIYQKIGTLFGLKRFDFNLNVSYDDDTIQEFLTTSQQSYNKPAKNALFSFNNDRVESFRPEEKGLEIDTDKFKESFTKAVKNLKNNPQNISVTLTDTVIEPEITLAKANQFGIEELIGEGKSDYTHSIPEREHNVILGTSKFNGVLIPKDAVFSFNDTVGDISAATGYQPAYVIKNGRTVLGDGGGICQVSTTLFRAALNTGLPVIERTAHAYRVGYYENDAKPGLDATVFAPSVDLKIKNDTPAYILIQTEIDKEHKLVYFRMYGKKDGRKAELSPISVWDVAPPPDPLMQDDPTLRRGTTKQVDFAAWGGKSRYTYTITYASGDVQNKTFYSVYRPWQAVYLVGTGDF